MPGKTWILQKYCLKVNCIILLYKMLNKPLKKLLKLCLLKMKFLLNELMIYLN